ncbi:MAG: hypothetical protein IJK04_12475, partial [Kiritimatiellae bacterium]|nr:hypothetical protein [Kiritimatiellia bacterium]
GGGGSAGSGGDSNSGSSGGGTRRTSSYWWSIHSDKSGGKGGEGGSAGSNGQKGSLYYDYDNGVTLSFDFDAATAISSHSAIEYTLKFSDATRLTETKNVKLGYALPAAPTPLDRPGWRFNGWFTGEDGTGAKYYDENCAALYDEYFNVGDVTLYASWTLTDPSAAGRVFVNGTALVGGRTQSGDGWYYDGGSGYLRLHTAGKRYVVSGWDSAGEFTVWGAASCEVVLSNLTIDAGQKINGPPFEAAAGESPVLVLAGENRLYGPANHPAIYVQAGSTLTIRDGGGTVHANGGVNAPGIGGMVGETSGTGALKIEGGTIYATGGSDGPGIGAAKESGFGTTTISGGYITASGGINGSGIGGGKGAGLGTYIISGGTVTARGGATAPGIGCGPGGIGGNVKISGGNVTAAGGSYGAGIGCGEGGTGCTVVIEGGKVSANGGSSGAGIGGGKGGAFSSITITGGEVRAIGGTNSGTAGIGGGFNGTGGAIRISGGDITASSSGFGAGIGTGDADNDHKGMTTGISVEISGGRITATSAKGAGIGPGDWLPCGAITISGGTVNAAGGSSCAAIGKSGSYSASSVTIHGGAIQPVQNNIRPAPTNNTSQAVFQVDFDIGEPSGKASSLTLGGALASYAYGTKDLYTDENGNLRVYLPSTSGVAFVAKVTMENGNTYYFSFGIDDEGKVEARDYIVVNDAIVASDADHSGTGWNYKKSTGILTLTANADVQGRSTNGAFRIVVPSTSNASAISFKNLTLAAAKKDGSTVKFERAVTLTLSGLNIISANGQYSAGIEIASDATLTLSGAGTLAAQGGKNAAGIGSAGGIAPPGKIVVESGTIIAVGGEKAAGIGGGVSANLVAGNIVITGGSVIAQGGSLAAGIGAGYGRQTIPSGAVAISGGTVLSAKGSGVTTADLITSGNAIATTSYDTSFVITGGSVHGANLDVKPTPIDAGGRVLRYLLVTNLTVGATAQIDSDDIPADYGMNDVVADETGAICLWLPATNIERIVTIDGAFFAINGSTNNVINVANGADVPPDKLRRNGSDFWRVSLPHLAPGATLSFSGLEPHATSAKVEDDGNAYVFLPDGEYAFTVDGAPWAATVANAPAVAHRVTGVFIGGEEVGTLFGDGWAYDFTNGVLTLDDGGADFVLSGTNTEGKVRVSALAAASVTLSNLSLVTCSNSPTFELNPGTELRIFLEGANTVLSTNWVWYYSAPAIFVPSGATLRINATNSPCGSLESRGGYGCAAIGGKYMGGNNTGTIIVEGGEINATGGFRSAAIGGGWQGAGGTIEIAGGIVTATSGDYPGINYSAAIGGGFGNGAYAPAYRQSGGTVVAYGSFDDIGGGALRASSAATITGGSLHLAARDRIRPAPSNSAERVWCVTVTNFPPNALVEDLAITNGTSIAEYGIDGLYADAEGKIYLWLPDGKYALTRGNGSDEWHFDVSGADIVATYGPQAIPLESLSIESVTVTDDAVILVVSAVPEEWLADNAKKLRVRASDALPLPDGDDALLPVTDVTATPNPDGTVTLTLPRTADPTQFFRVEGE